MMASSSRQLQIQLRSGSVVIGWNDREQLTHVRWVFEKEPIRSSLPIPVVVAELADRLRAYFEGGRPLGPVPWEHLDQSGWSDFQRQVYFAISRIPHAETRTYGWVAGRIQRGTAHRAVGQALRNNPLPILIPCHRVVSTHSLGGFMGASDPAQPELALKQRLLAIEDLYRSPLFDFAAQSA